MNILLTTHNYYPYKIGGTEVYVANLASFLTAHHHHICIIAAVDDEAFNDNNTIYEDENLRVCNYYHEHILIFGVQYNKIETQQIYSRQSLKHQQSWNKVIASNDFLNSINILHVNGFTPTIGLDLIYSLKQNSINLRVISSYHTAISCAKETLLFANTLKEQRPNIDHVADMFSYRLNIPYSIGKILSLISPNIHIDFLPAFFNIKYFTKISIESFIKLDQLTDEWWVYSNGIKNHLIDIHVSPEKIVFERHGISDFFIGNKRKLHKPHIFFFSGRIIKNKGFFTLLNAWLQLPQTDDKELWIAGRPHSDDENIQKLILTANKRKDINWLGKLDQQSIASTYSMVNTVIIPSEWYEIGPLVFHEAIASGCRVISSDIGGCKELAEFYNDRSTTFKTGDANDLRKKILLKTQKPDNLSPEIKVLSFKAHFENILNKSKIYGKKNNLNSSL